MNATRRGLRGTIGIGVIAAGLIVGMSPAYAVGLWEPGGYKPTCDVAYPISYTDYSYFDFTKPTASLAVTPTIVVGNTPKAATLATLTMKDTCSGVSQFQIYIALNGGIVTGLLEAAPSEKSHYYKRTLSGSFNVGDVGDWTFPNLLVADRFDSFDLSGDFKTLTNDVTRTGLDTIRYAYSTEKYASVHCYILKQTVLTQSTSKTSIKKGAAVTISGKLTVANGSGFSNVVGRSVSLQFKSGSTWKTAASKATSTSGAASFSVKPTSTKTWRLSYAGNKTSLFYAPKSTVGTQVKVS